ncbi:MAG TPA: DNA mismatch repair protein MutS [Bacteroidaceae bacterium]|nr:DNA mismatch repair protein MutS [Bacteroidaceae bacterium]
MAKKTKKLDTTIDGIVLTPMMKQFLDLKEKHPDAIMLFRCGDFYETYSTDAVDASQILGITLTKRANGKDKKIEMAGFPFHALDTYLPKLIRAGRRVAICDQLEDPKATNKLVKRGITELVTPGVSVNDNVLQQKENNFLASIYFHKKICGISFLDISTGEFLVAQGDAVYVEKLLMSFSPKEVLHERNQHNEFCQAFGDNYCTYQLDDWVYTMQHAQERLNHQFGTANLKGFGVEHVVEGVIAAGAILQYLLMTHHTQTSHIRGLSRIEEERYVRLDRFTVRSLELLHPMTPEGVSLLSVLDRTFTSMGGRLLRRWINLPLKEEAEINARLAVVEYLFKHPDFRDLLMDKLPDIADLERIVSRVASNRINPREMVLLYQALHALVPIKNRCLQSDNLSLHGIGEKLSLCEALRDRLTSSLQPEPPLLINKGNVIAKGVSDELDDLRRIAYSGKDYLLQLQQKESEATGIPSLKIAYNNVFGYYLEVRNSHKDKVPSDWIRKQTLVNAERYITQELKEYEDKILGAEDKIQQLETKLYNELIQAICPFMADIQQNALQIATLDCLLSFAQVAQQNRYIRPVISDDHVLDIRQGRHPVIEQQLPLGESYIPNDTYLDNQKQQIIIITGPNMAGKSALLRQTALITLMAQMGSFVPAESAHIGLVDKVFTRVGASDNISMGESTFMVEMNEASNILNNLSPRSLILFDELGRGTSTYDGISIAWAIVEYIHENTHGKARTLFATHYHELNEMEERFERIRNYNVSVREVDNKVIFLRKLQAGGSEHSFGIHVAKIAGMPTSIINRSNAILKQLEADREHGKQSTKETVKQITVGDNKPVQLSLFQLGDPVLTQIRDEILSTQIDNLTPIEALNKLAQIKKILIGGSEA